MSPPLLPPPNGEAAARRRSLHLPGRAPAEGHRLGRRGLGVGRLPLRELPTGAAKKSRRRSEKRQFFFFAWFLVGVCFTMCFFGFIFVLKCVLFLGVFVWAPKPLPLPLPLFAFRWCTTSSAVGSSVAGRSFSAGRFRLWEELFGVKEATRC